jgi:hypothetical protein
MSNLVEKKVFSLGLKGEAMYFTNKQLAEAKTKWPDYNFIPCDITSPMVKGYHAYTMVERSEWANEMQKLLNDIILPNDWELI